MHSIFVAVSSTYTFVSTPRTWSDANADCLAHGGTLATIPNAAAQSALMSSIDLSAIGGETAEERGSGGFWVGASDRQSEGHWTWHGAHRESLTYENWATRARAAEIPACGGCGAQLAAQFPHISDPPHTPQVRHLDRRPAQQLGRPGDAGGRRGLHGRLRVRPLV